MLEENAALPEGGHRGAVKRGSAACLSAGGMRIGKAVVKEVLLAIQPVGIEAAMQAADHLTQANDQKRESLTLALDRAQFEARRAQGHFDVVDPDHRLIAGELEAPRNEAHERVEALAARIAQLDERAEPFTEAQRETLLTLGCDLTAAWEYPAADITLRKRMLRTVLKGIILDNDEDPPGHELCLNWQRGVRTDLGIPRNCRGQHAKAADGDAIELVRELSKVADDNREDRLTLEKCQATW